MPTDDPYEELREVAGALLPNNSPSDRGSGKFTPSNPSVIPLEGQL